MAPRWRNLASLAALFAAFDAGAASFDCAKAARPQEKLVCSDPALSKLDEQMAAGYRTARGLVSEPGRSQLLAGQRAWLRYWPRDCSSKRVSIVFDENAVACARVRYELRIEALKVDTAFDGKFKVYDVADYAARWTPKDDDIRSVVVGHTWVYPQIDLAGLGGADARFAKAMNAWVAPKEKAIRSLLGDALSTSVTRITLRTVSSRILGATTEEDWWGVGAAHPLSSIEHRYFDRKHMRPLRAGDVFRGREWVSTLRDLALAEVKEKFADSLLVADLHGLTSPISDTRRWILGREGLGIQFGEYEVASYAAGMPIVTIPWTRLDGYLTEFARAEFGVPRSASIATPNPGQMP